MFYVENGVFGSLYRQKEVVCEGIKKSVLTIRELYSSAMLGAPTLPNKQHRNDVDADAFLSFPFSGGARVWTSENVSVGYVTVPVIECR